MFCTLTSEQLWFQMNSCGLLYKCLALLTCGVACIICCYFCVTVCIPVYFMKCDGLFKCMFYILLLYCLLELLAIVVCNLHNELDHLLKSWIIV